MGKSFPPFLPFFRAYVGAENVPKERGYGVGFLLRQLPLPVVAGAVILWVPLPEASTYLNSCFSSGRSLR